MIPLTLEALGATSTFNHEESMTFPLMAGTEDVTVAIMALAGTKPICIPRVFCQLSAPQVQCAPQVQSHIFMQGWVKSKGLLNAISLINRVVVFYAFSMVDHRLKTLYHCLSV